MDGERGRDDRVEGKADGEEACEQRKLTVPVPPSGERFPHPEPLPKPRLERAIRYPHRCLDRDATLSTEKASD